MQGGEDVQHLALKWDEAEIRRNGALLQQLCQGQGQASAHPHLLAVLGLTDAAADATRAAAHVETADAVGVSGAPPGATSAAWPCHTGLLRGSLQESNILYQEIIALKSQLQGIHHGLQQAHPPGQTKQECEQLELKQDQQQHGADSLRWKKSQPFVTDSDDDWGRDLEAREPRRRGRPLKQAGRYSKNYEAIKRYRAKKKGMNVITCQQTLVVSDPTRANPELLHNAMPGFVGQVEGLQAQLLRHRRHQKAYHVRDLAALLATYKQYVSECAALMCVIHLDKQQQEQHEEQKQQEEQGQKKQNQEQQGRGQGQGSPPLKCEASSQGLHEQHQEVQQQQGHAARAHSNNGSSSSTTITSGSPQAAQALAFPPQPFSVIEVINCWRIAKHGAVPPEVAGAAKEEGGEGQSLGELQINLETGQHEVVPVQHWHNAASEVTLRPEQLQQLAAGWQLLVRALMKLNKEREQLKQQLEAVMRNTFGVVGDVSAGPCSSQQQEAPSKSKPSRAFDRHDSASSTSSESVAHQDSACGATDTCEPPNAAQTSKSGCLPICPAAAAAAAAAPGMDAQVDSQLAEMAQDTANVQQAADMVVNSPPGSTSRSGLAASAAAGGAAGCSACPAGPFSSSDMPVAAGSLAGSSLSESFVSVAERWVVLDQYGQLADAVERNLLQGRAVVSMFGWALWQVFNDEQMGRLSVRSWPYWPLARAIVACLLGKQSVLLEKHSC
eukprot:gene7758-7957_t